MCPSPMPLQWQGPPKPSELVPQPQSGWEPGAIVELGRTGVGWVSDDFVCLHSAARGQQVPFPPPSGRGQMAAGLGWGWEGGPPKGHYQQPEGPKKMRPSTFHGRSAPLPSRKK